MKRITREMLAAAWKYANEGQDRPRSDDDKRSQAERETDDICDFLNRELAG